MLTDLGTSSYWAAIKKAVSQLELSRKILRSKMGRDSLNNTILQIVLANRFVSAIA